MLKNISPIKGLGLLLALLLYFNTSCQVNYRDYVRDSLFTSIEKDYVRVRDFYLNNKNVLKYETSEVQVFLIHSLLNKDTLAYFKVIDEIAFLKNYSINRCVNSDLFDLIKLEVLLDKTSNIIKNRNVTNKDRKIEHLLEDLKKIDQCYRGFYGSFRYNDIYSDFYGDLDAIHDKIDSLNIEILMKKAIDDKMFYNNFDFECATYEKFQFILAHYLRRNNANFERVFSFLNDYGSIAYNENKIDNSIFYLFDVLCSNVKGYQYFGTLKDVPIVSNLFLKYKGAHFQ